MMGHKELHLELDDDTAERVKRLTMRLPRAPRTTSATIRIALHLLDRCLEVQEGSGAVVFRDANGVTIDVEIG